MDPSSSLRSRKFFILSYPRSRTKWLSVALEGTHDGFLGCRSVWDLKERLSYSHGNSDSANLLFYPQLKEAFPDGKFLIVLRDLEEVEESMLLEGFDTEGLPFMEERMEELLDSGIPVVKYEDINSSGSFIWKTCRGEGFDSMRWESLCGQNLQVDVPAYLLEVARERESLAALCQTLK